MKRIGNLTLCKALAGIAGNLTKIFEKSNAREGRGGMGIFGVNITIRVKSRCKDIEGGNSARILSKGEKQVLQAAIGSSKGLTGIALLPLASKEQ